MKIRTFGIHDGFSLRDGNKESLTLVENNGITLAIDCPGHTLRSLYKDSQIVSQSTKTKVDFLLITHTDTDHIGGLPNLIWGKVFGEGKKLNLVTHPQIYSDLWEILKRSGFGFDRTKENLKEKEMSDYCQFFPIGYDEKIHIPGFGQIETFSRATKHQAGMDVLAGKISDDKEKDILGFSSDTGFDHELIEFLFSQKGKILHEVGSYKYRSYGHTDIRELMEGIPKSEHKRLFVNHIPEIREDEILSLIKKYKSKIRLASGI